MKKTFILVIVLALLAMNSSLLAELDSVNLFDQKVDPGFEGADLSAWTVVNGSTAVDNTISNTGDAALGYNAVWGPMALDILDGNVNDAHGLPNMPAGKSKTD